VKRRSTQSGLTLIEMIVVVSIVGLVAAVSFPSISSGLDSLRLTTASDSIVSFLNAGMNRAERRQQLVEVTLSKAENAIWLRSVDPSFNRRLEMPDGVTITKIHPEIPDRDETARSYMLYPGGTVPRFGVEIANRKGSRRIVRVDPITGVPEVQLLQ
jgi:prepilin-type N-terminal cleavage/methylation domain-containing protein